MFVGSVGQTPAARGTGPQAASPTSMLREFRVDVENCACGGKLRLKAFITDPLEAQRYLEHEGLPSAWPVIAPARAPPQVEMAFGGG